MNILINIHNIAYIGGVEHFVAKFCEDMTRRGHQVFCFTWAPEHSPPAFAMDARVRIVHYRLPIGVDGIHALRKQILDCAPDVFVSPASENEHLLWCAALAGTGIPWIFSERSDPWIIEKKLWNREERHAALHVADRIHLFFDKYRATIPAIEQDRVRIIPNCVDITLTQETDRPGGCEKKSKKILSLGRLTASKQNTLLLRAFALLRKEFPDWQLDIWGEGKKEKCILELEISLLGLRDSARLRGPTAAPREQYMTADLFGFPSLYEGFGLVVIEAMSHGLPVVGFAGCAALNELVRHSETGLLAPEMTAESLALSLRTLMSDADLRRKMGENARRSVAAYAPQRIFDAWEKMLVEASACKGQTQLQQCLNGTDANSDRRHAKLREVLRRKNILSDKSQCIQYIALNGKKLFQAGRRVLSAAAFRCAMGLRGKGTAF
ncbi:MAG: glycosyltransferase [Desulfovibrio sp.]|jgi:glycosyltransferase involved in cell wall biosynthesis|nr:glycosyltransferase [Desulfovibrio sp.]